MNLSINEQGELVVPPMTPEQQIVYEGILNFFREGRVQEGTFEGYAGVGKSFVISRVLDTMIEQDPWTGIAFTATTNKALQVLLRNSHYPTVQYLTVHQLLGLKEKIDWYTGKVEFVKDTWRPAPIESISRIFLDEASQLHSHIYGLLKQELKNRPDLKILYVGDPFQIPPVNDRDHIGRPADAIPMYRWKELKFAHFRLDEIVRQAKDNPIIQYATAIRKGRPYQWLDTLSTDPVEVEKTLQDMFCSGEFLKDSDHAKVIAYRNKTVDYMNKWIRELLLGKNIPFIVVGDRLVAFEPVIEGDTVSIRNSQEMIVLEATKGESTINWSGKNYVFQMYNATVQLKELSSPVIKRIRILSDVSHKAFWDLVEVMGNSAKRERNEEKKKAKWAQYWRTKRYFAQVVHNYSVTAHKAQGSTYNTAISLEWDINTQRDTRERERIRYVAATRPSNRLIVC